MNRVLYTIPILGMLSLDSPAGPYLVADIAPGLSSSHFLGGEMLAYGGRILFSANDGVYGHELWTTDGTSEGTYLLRDVVPGRGSSYPSRFTLFNGTVFFSARDPDGDAGDLWRSDGTTEGTFKVKDVGAVEFRELNGKLVFAGTDRAHGTELWVTDGTVAGTRMIKDIRPGDWSSEPSELVQVGQSLFFLAHDGGRTGGFGRASFPLDGLWRTDGAPSGTVSVKQDFLGERIEILGAVRGRILLLADRRHLWRSDGTEAGTVAFFYLPELGGALAKATLGDSIFLSTELGLFRTDGTSAGTLLVKQGEVHGLARVGALLFFASQDLKHGLELWRSDGTTRGTFMVRDIREGPADSSPRFFNDVNGHLLFQADGGSSSESQLWLSDGTPEGTRLIGSVPLENSLVRFERDFSHGALVRDLFVFSANGGPLGRELWAVRAPESHADGQARPWIPRRPEPRD